MNSNKPRTLDSWIKETHDLAHFYNDRYVVAKADQKFPKFQVDHYSEVAKNYWKLHEFLKHIKKFSGHIDEKNCSQCRSDLTHCTLNKKLYSKYKFWIDRLQNFSTN